MTLLRVIDFETTGLPPTAGVIEVGWCDVHAQLDKDENTVGWSIDPPQSMLIKQSHPISPEARACHHISDAQIDAKGRLWVDAAQIMSVGPPEALVAHNAKFEQEFFTPQDVPWICTMKCAYKVWPDAPTWSNQVLRYYLELVATDDPRAMPPHRAGPDAWVTAHLLVAMLKKGVTPRQMIGCSSRPSILPRVMFGKHFGKKWNEVDRGYLQWCLKQDMDEDVKATCRYHLKEAA